MCYSGPNMSKECGNGYCSSQHTSNVWNFALKIMGRKVTWYFADGHDLCHHSCFWSAEKVI